MTSPMKRLPSAFCIFDLDVVKVKGPGHRISREASDEARPVSRRPLGLSIYILPLLDEMR